MKRNNPFYHFLKKYQKSLTQTHTDKHGNHFLILSLPTIPPELTNFHYEGLVQTFIEHHITVFEEINDEVGFESTYHYTIRFEQHLFHIYFNQNGVFISATIQNNTSHGFKNLTDFLDNDLFFIHEFLNNTIKPMMLNLFEQHVELVSEHKTRYMAELSSLKTILFENPTDILNHLSMVQKVITKAEALKPLSHSQTFIKQTLSFLKGYEKALKDAIKARNKAKVDVPLIESVSIEDVEDIKVTSTAKIESKKTSKEYATPSYSTEICQFETVYEQFEQQWSLLKSSQEDISARLEQFAIISQNTFIDLNRLALILLELIESPTPKQQGTYNKANLDVNLFSENLNQLGISLLIECFHSSVLLEKYKPLLRQFVVLLNHHQLEDAIRCGHIPVLEFLLEHGRFNLNDVRIRTNKKGLKLSPLCAAYKSNNIELFEVLLKHHASPLAFYEGMPLAHVILQLKMSDPFYQCLMQHCPKVMNSDPRFFKFLCKAVDSRMSTTALTEKEKHGLHHAKEKYLRIISNSFESVKISASTRQNMLSLANAFNPNTIELIKTSSSIELNNLVEQITIKSKELYSIMKKRHLTKKFMSKCEKIYKEAVTKTENIKTILGQASLEDCIESVRKNLEGLEAAIDYVNLSQRASLSKHEETLLRNAKIIIQRNMNLRDEAEKQSKSSAGNLFSSATTSALDSIQVPTEAYHESSPIDSQMILQEITASLAEEIQEQLGSLLPKPTPLLGEALEIWHEMLTPREGRFFTSRQKPQSSLTSEHDSTAPSP